jgi:hypothetical protein
VGGSKKGGERGRLTDVMQLGRSKVDVGPVMSMKACGEWGAALHNLSSIKYMEVSG